MCQADSFFKHERKKQQVLDVLCRYCMYLYIMYIERRCKNLFNVSGVKFVVFCAFILPVYNGRKSPLEIGCNSRAVGIGIAQLRTAYTSFGNQELSS